MLHKDNDRQGLVEKISLFVGLRVLGAKTNWLAGKRHSWTKFDLDFEERAVVREPLFREDWSLETERITVVRNCYQETSKGDTADYKNLSWFVKYGHSDSV
jgi:hypothetical protein